MKLVPCVMSLALMLVTSAASAQTTGTFDQRHYIYIEATGTVDADADMTRISISLSEKKPTPEDATKLVSDKIAQFSAGSPSSGSTTRQCRPTGSSSRRPTSSPRTRPGSP